MGLLADQFLFFATSEEIVFRGFLLGQLYRKLRDLLTA
jgi:membrane protease YdiL (CAAX protease family)